MLPCAISHDGPAAISHFFLVEKAPETAGSANTAPMRAHFRGRAIEGQVRNWRPPLQEFSPY